MLNREYNALKYQVYVKRPWNQDYLNGKNVKGCLKKFEKNNKKRSKIPQNYKKPSH